MKILRSLLPVTILNGIVLFIITLNLPSQVPVHMNIHMEVDGIGSRWMVAIFGLIPIVLSVVFLVYRHKTQNSKWVKQNRKVENILLPTIIAFITVITWLPVLLAYQHEGGMGSKMELQLDALIMFVVGIFMIIISNFMGIIKHNKYLGIRTTWTLSSETVWKKTHRLGGGTGVIGGIIMCFFSILALILKTSVLSTIGLILGLVFVAVIPIIYSYIVYKKEQA